MPVVLRSPRRPVARVAARGADGWRRLAWLVALLLVIVAARETPRAATRVARAVTMADGLPHDTVWSLLRDRHGFIWIATSRGLARLDATGIVSFGVRDGLPDPVVNDLLEDRHGRLWAATNGGGLARLRVDAPDAPPTGTARVFDTIRLGPDRRANRINALVETRDGAILAGTDAGLYRLGPDAGLAATVVPQPIALGLPGTPDATLVILTIVPDARGDFWIGTNVGLIHHRPGGGSRLYRDAAGPPRQLTRAVLIEPDGQVLAAFDRRIIRIRAPEPPPAAGGVEASIHPSPCNAARTPPAPAPHTPHADRTPAHAAAGPCLAALPEAPPQDTIVDLLRPSPDRTIVVSAQRVIEARADGVTTRLFDAGADMITGAHLLPGEGLWISTRAGGAVQLRDTPFEAFDTTDGLDALFVRHLFTDRDGSLYAMTANWTVSRFTPSAAPARFVTAHPRDAARWPHTGWMDYIIRTRSGEWWATTADGLVQFPAVPLEALPRTRPITTHPLAARLTGGVRLRGLFEDSRGDIWAGTVSGDGRTVLTRWQRASGTLRTYTVDEGLERYAEAALFTEDRAGRVWVSFRDGGIARIDDAAGVVMVRDEDGGRAAAVRTFHLDARGRLWLALRVGLARIDDPGAGAPRLVVAPEAAALTSDQITAIAEDREGRIYFGHANGIDRHDLRTGALRSFGRADGLPRGEIRTALALPDGSIWFGTSLGVFRLTPAADEKTMAPRALISGVSVNGVHQWVPPSAAARLAPLTLADGTAALDLRVAIMPASLAARPRFQYRLVRSGDEPWSDAASPRLLTLSYPPPGRYRLEVRAVGPDGRTSAQTAVLPFDVLAPLWRRPWVLALAGAAMAAALLLLHRYRLAQALRLERIRARIATDLHDDIGASLSHIAILAEVLRPRTRHLPEAAATLDQMAATSRTLVDSMSDIVWSINPRRDALGDLVRRVRRFAEDALETAGVALTFDAPRASLSTPLSPDLRRELLLFVKEGVTNIVRHAQATEAHISLRLEGRAIALTIRDNGRGFDPAARDAAPDAPGDADRDCAALGDSGLGGNGLGGNGLGGNGLGGNGLDNLRRRAAALDGELRIASAPGRGTTISLTSHGARGRWRGGPPSRRRWRFATRSASAPDTAARVE